MGRSTPHYSKRKLDEEFGELMSKEFKMSMIGELTFFVGFQVKQMREEIFISQENILMIFSRDSK